MIRTALAAVLLVLLLPAVVIANVSNWAARTVADDATFTATVGRVLDTPTLRATISQRVSDEVTRYLTSNPETLRLLATEILRVPETTSIEDVRANLRVRLAAALDDPAVRRARDEAIEQIHAFVLDASTGGDGVVRIQGDELVLDTGPLVERLAAAVDARLTPTTVELPAQGRLVVLASARALGTVSTALSLLEVIQFLIPLIAVVAALAIIGLAHRRVRALGLVGLAVTAAGAVTLVAAWVGGQAVGDASPDFTVRELATEAYAAFATVLVWQAVALIVGGLILALIAWVTLRRRRRRTTRAPSAPGGVAA